MLGLKEIRQLLGDKNKSDQEIEQIRDALRILAEIVFEQWLSEEKSVTKKEQPAALEKVL